MKKKWYRILYLVLCTLFLSSTLPRARAYEKGDGCRIDLASWIQDTSSRSYVEMMLDHYVRTDRMVQNALKDGFSAVFLFDGCSDNMNDPILSDLSYYRVSGVCIVLRLDRNGQVKMVYFNDSCSTIPDRPLEIGAWYLSEEGKVGPATVCDGTYQLYSVRHKGRYEALNARTEYQDRLLDAIYMTEDSFVRSRASEINIHTRTVNHILTNQMWSAGCPLIGAGKSWEYWKLMESVYYTVFEDFEIDLFVGSVTIDRQALRRELYNLYGNPDAVDAFLEHSTAQQPSAYLAQCPVVKDSAEDISLRTTGQTNMMTLPCDFAADARSLLRTVIPKGERVKVLQTVTNTDGEKWYKVSWKGTNGYVRSEDVEKGSWLTKWF